MEILDPRAIADDVIERDTNTIDRCIGRKQLAAVDRIGTGACDTTGRNVGDLTLTTRSSQAKHSNRSTTGIGVCCAIDRTASGRVSCRRRSATAEGYRVGNSRNGTVTQSHRIGRRGTGARTDSHAVCTGSSTVSQGRVGMEILDPRAVVYAVDRCRVARHVLVGGEQLRSVNRVGARGRERGWRDIGHAHTACRSARTTRRAERDGIATDCVVFHRDVSVIANAGIERGERPPYSRLLRCGTQSTGSADRIDRLAETADRTCRRRIGRAGTQRGGGRVT